MKNTKMFSRMIVLVFFFIAFGASTNALTKIEIANENYNEASKLLASGDCVNASDDAERALNLYTGENYAEGVTKTMDLIGKISDCIKKNADKKYDEAYKNYIAKKYTDAVTWAQRAKEEYARVPGFDGENGVSKCNNLISDTLILIKELEIKDADTKYQKAYSLYEQQDFGNAKKLATDAFNLYNHTGYEQGLALVNALFQEIDNRVIELRNIADESLRAAREQYKSAYDTANFEAYIEASKKAEEAKSLYSKINYIQGYKDAQEVIANSNNEIGRMEDMSKQKATAYFNSGRNEQLLGRGAREDSEKRAHFDKAEKNFSMARAIYQKLYEWSNDRGDSVKKDAYKLLISDCDTRLGEIAVEKNNIVTRRKADDLFIGAQSLYTKGECKDASKYADDAKALFQKVNDQPSVFKSDTLIYQIKDCINKMKKAEVNLANVSRYYKVADYTNASLELDKASKIYIDIKNQAGITNCANLKVKIAESSGKKKNADQLMTQAQNDFKDRKYEDSIKSATDAMNVYTGINFLEGIAKANALIKQNQDRIALDKQEGEKNIMITIGAIVAAIVLVMVVWGARRVQKQRSEKEKMDAEKRKFAEEMRRKREEEKLREEGRSRELEMEREKLKSMIAAEMKKAEKDRKDLQKP